MPLKKAKIGEAVEEITYDLDEQTQVLKPNRKRFKVTGREEMEHPDGVRVIVVTAAKEPE